MDPIPKFDEVKRAMSFNAKRLFDATVNSVFLRGELRMRVEDGETGSAVRRLDRDLMLLEYRRDCLRKKRAVLMKRLGAARVRNTVRPGQLARLKPSDPTSTRPGPRVTIVEYLPGDRMRIERAGQTRVADCHDVELRTKPKSRWMPGSLLRWRQTTIRTRKTDARTRDA